MIVAWTWAGGWVRRAVGWWVSRPARLSWVNRGDEPILDDARGRVCPVLRIGPVVAAARAAVRPAGPVRWIAEAVDGGIELRTAVRRWSVAGEPPARLARVACGAALRAARLAVAVQGRRPLVSYPERTRALVVLRAGGLVVPSRRDLLLHGVLRDGGAASSVGPPGRAATVRWLRHVAEAEGTWLRVVQGVDPVAVGPAWGGPREEGRPVGGRADGSVAFVGASGRPGAVDPRLGQSLETIRLTASALGLGVRVLAAPAEPTTETAPYVAPGTRSLALIEVGGAVSAGISRPCCPSASRGTVTR